MNLLILFILILLVLEIFFKSYIKNLRSTFQWLIIKNFDLHFNFDKKKIKKFKKNSYEKNLGWITKPNLVKYDYVKSFGERAKKKFKKVKYTHNKVGARFNPNFEKKKEKIISFGDSFVFNRHVNDNETWQHELSKLTNSNVSNYGVGNYGVDQSILRMNKIIKNKKKKIIILGFVPETIVRIHSVWRHFYEYGNVFAFKPRFFLKNGQLRLYKNPIKNLSNINNIKKKIKNLKRIDYWYEKKFKLDLIKFPFLCSVLKNFPRNILVIYYLTLYKIFSSNTYYNKAWRVNLKNNFNYVIKSYKDKDMVNLLIEEIKFFTIKVNKHRGKPVVIIFPYLDDLNHIVKTNTVFYEEIVKKISSFVDVIDLSTKILKSKNRKKYFVNSFYGSHLSKIGNKMIAKNINSFLKKNLKIKI